MDKLFELDPALLYELEYMSYIGQVCGGRREMKHVRTWTFTFPGCLSFLSQFSVLELGHGLVESTKSHLLRCEHFSATTF